jgi:hypothetical protein
LLLSLQGCAQGKSIAFTVVDARHDALLIGVAVEHKGEVDFFTELFAGSGKKQSISIPSTAGDGAVRVRGLDRELGHYFRLSKQGYKPAGVLFFDDGKRRELFYASPEKGSSDPTSVPTDGTARIPLNPEGAQP